MSRKLRFCYSTMNSGKTLRLLTMAYNFEENGIPFLTLKPSADTRDGKNVIKSRVGLKRDCVVVTPDIDLFEAVMEYNNFLKSQLSKLEWILVDEAQFLTEKQVEQLAAIVDKLDIDIMCFGLRTDFQTKMFPASKRLMELADDIEELKSRCKCGRKTIVNARFDENGEIVLNGSQVVVGGNKMYTPLCRKCYHKAIKEKLLKDENNQK